MTDASNAAPTRTVHHGNTPAAWTVVVIVTLAFVVGTLGIMMANWMLFWVGVGMLVIGAVAGKVLQMMGLGAVPRR